MPWSNLSFSNLPLLFLNAMMLVIIAGVVGSYLISFLASLIELVSWITRRVISWFS